MKVILPGRPFPRPPSSVILFLMEYACGNISGAGGRTRTDMSSEARQILSLVRIPISPLRREGMHILRRFRTERNTHASVRF